MKRSLSQKLAATGGVVAVALAFTLAANQAVAVPYASLIRFGEPALVGGAINVDLSYTLNEDADSVTVELYNLSTASVVRTYDPAPNTQGRHTIVWDGLDDGANPVVIGGNQFVIRVRVQKLDETAGWTPLTSNSGGAKATIKQNLVSNFSPSSIKISHDPDSNQFGVVYVAHDAGAGTPMGGVMLLGTDLDPLLGDGGGANLRGHHPSTGTGGNGVWTMSFDPLDPDLLYWGGQAGVTFPRVGVFNIGALNPADYQVVADNVFTGAPAMRAVAVGLNGLGDRVGYISHDIATANISRLAMASDYPHSAAVHEPIGIPLDSNVPYVIGMHVDGDGNLYALSRNVPALRRWNSATVDAAPGDPITEANAVWTVRLPVGSPNFANALHVDETTGNVYVGLNSGAGLRGVYLAGNISDDTLDYTMTTANRIIDYDDAALFPVGFGANQLHHGVATDFAGNLYVATRPSGNGTGEIYAFSPAGQSTPYDITTQSPQVLTDDLLLITLESFAASAAGYGAPVTITWSTSAEIDNTGFHLDRVSLAGSSPTPAGRVNAFLIPAAGVGGGGAEYTFVDAQPLAEGEKRGYVLVDVDANGGQTTHGPVSVQVGTSSEAGEAGWGLY